MMLANSSAVVLTSSVVDWKMFAAWVDTEGSISSVVAKNRVKNGGVSRKRHHELAVYQTDESALGILRDFLCESGISATYLYKDKRTAVWSLKLTRIKDIEFVVSSIEPYILTENKKRQIERFKRFRAEKYKRIEQVAA